MVRPRAFSPGHVLPLHQAGSHTLTLLSSGQVLAVGGADAELYTP